MEDVENVKEMVFGRSSLSLTKLLTEVSMLVRFLYGSNWATRRSNTLYMAPRSLSIFATSFFSSKKSDDESRRRALITFMSISSTMEDHFCTFGCNSGTDI